MDKGKMLWFAAVLAVCLGSGMPATAASENNREFVLGPADVIAISVLDNKDMDSVATIGPDGQITFPILGAVKAGGLTPTGLAEKIKADLSKSIRNPVVNVFLREINSYVVYFVGRVGRPGPLVNKRETTLLQAIATAGGVAEGADLSLAYLARRDTKVPVDFAKLLRVGDLTHNVILEPGDTIVVPEDEKKDVYVMGEVKAPGPFPVSKEKPLSVLRAVALARGFTEFAAPARTVILRGKDGAKATIPVDVRDLIKNPEGNRDISLEPGDVLMVPRGLF